MTAVARRSAVRPHIAALRPRRVELGLIALIAIVVVSAYGLASLGESASVPANIGPFLAWMLGLFFFVHLAVRRFAPAADPVILPMALLLNGIGYVMIARLGEDVTDGSDLAGLQSVWTAVGIAGFVVTLILVPRIRSLAQYRYLLGVAGIGLLALPLLPIGIELNGARIWVALGPVSFQPGEFAKIALAIFFAAYLVENRELLGTATFKVGPIRMPEPKHLAPILVAWGLSLVLMIYEKDLGSALLFFVLFATVLWVATGRLSYLIISLGLFGAGAYFAWRTFSHVQVRVATWLDPWQDPSGDGFQIIQSSYALAWGGLTGTGLGLGINGRIPFEETDFIFAIIGEELGLAGTVGIVVTFLLIVGAGYRTAVQIEDPFSKLLAVGLTTLIGVQAFVIMGGVTRLLPLTGVTLPFVSYGGSSLLSNWILVALLVRISDSANSQAAEATDYDPETSLISVGH